ncbi:ribosome 60S biogenesis N-terminal-domain-containing protein [Crepidotus variabilis]|uniref:Ribosome 60S biogenesis N-terminal-domain-containing protein n=1 Tax=Crepidotus variabilis TaxID=179855 RepID=A0A9P6EJR5_9AGAR|nr:ribosome 60S biogenesis N-terminal-domain-containing protein [Crepidotus variabilis]
MTVQQKTKADYPNKRAKTEKSSSSTTKYANAAQIKAALQAENPDVLNQAVISLRSQISLKPPEDSVGPSDERLVLVKTWIEGSPGAQDLFTIWDNAHTRQSSLTALIISTLASVLTLLSAHYTNHALGYPIMKILLTPSRLRNMNSYLGGSHNELIIVTLKLYNVMSSFAGGRDKKAVLEGFGWEIKSLPKLLNMRRKSRERIDPLVRPDIRSLYILFLLSFLGVDTLTQTKATLLEQHREAFLAIFKGIADDHYTLMRKILEVCWSGIWEDQKLKRTLKVGLFNEITLGHLLKLYDRVQADDEDEDHIPANLVHHFLLAICSRPGVGICFRDRGWYPREGDLNDSATKDEEDNSKKPSRIYNKIFSNVIKTFKVNEDSRQQELAMKILSACPELVSGYWSTAALTLEPRLSSKWLTNIAFFGNIVDLPIPEYSFYLPNQLYNPTPPPLSIVIESILPSVHTKNNFSKGLQSTSGLVQHCTALALCKCLKKFQAVLEKFRTIAKALEEDEEDGQWTKRCRDIEREVRRRVPDSMVVIAFGQPKHDPQVSSPEKSKLEDKPCEVKPPNRTRDALLAESAQRLLFLYQKCLPSAVAEARFDTGKLLQTFVKAGALEAETEDEAIEAGPSERLHRIQQLHVMSLLKESDNFIWTTKIGSLFHTPLFTLLTAMTSAKTPAIQTALSDLIVYLLSRSILFQEDQNEAQLWIRALPAKPLSFSRIPAHLKARITLDLQDEAQGVINFLDDCVQRCLKAPYRYVEALRSLTTSTTPNIKAYPSPLLMTLLEQLEAKMNKKSLLPSHIIGVVTFIRKVTFLLAGKTDNLTFLRAVAEKLNGLLTESKLKYNETSVGPVRREVGHLKELLDFGVVSGGADVDIVENFDLKTWLSHLEKPVSESQSSQTAMAWLTVDEARTCPSSLSQASWKRVFDAISSLDPAVLGFLLEYIPTGNAIWDDPDIRSQIPLFRSSSLFEYLYVHACRHQSMDVEARKMLKEAALVSPTTSNQFSRIISYIQHGFEKSRNDLDLLADQIAFLSKITSASQSILKPEQADILKDRIFVRPEIFKEIWLAPKSQFILEAIQSFLGDCMPYSSSNRLILSDICNYWMGKLINCLDGPNSQLVNTATVWIQYLEPLQLFKLLELLQPSLHEQPNLAAPINQALATLLKLASSDLTVEASLANRLSLLYSLYSSIRDSPLLENLIAIGVNSMTPFNFIPSDLQRDNVAGMVGHTLQRWNHIQLTRTLVEVDVNKLLSQNVFSKATVSIVAGLLYLRISALEGVSRWFSSPSSRKHDIKLIAPICDAFLEVSSSISIAVDNNVWVTLVPGLLSLVMDKQDRLRRNGFRCLRNLILCFKPTSDLVSAISTATQALPGSSVTPELLGIGLELCHSAAGSVNDALPSIVDRGMQWAIRHLEDNEGSEPQKATLFRLTSLLNAISDTKAHLVDTLLSTVIRRHLANAVAVELVVSALAICHLKPATINRHLQSIIQHPHFLRLMVVESVRDCLTQLLHRLFNLHPNNTCQITHIEPLIKIYRGTLAMSDLRILSVFQLFENQRKLSVGPLLSRWSATPSGTSNSALESLQSLDPIMVLRTYIELPCWCALENHALNEVDRQKSGLYNPAFLMLLFLQAFAEKPPSSAFEWLELLRTNIVSLFIRCLSAKDGQIRAMALDQVVVVWSAMKYADLQEKPHVLHVLNLLKNVLHQPAPHGDEGAHPDRLPTHITLLLAHALRGVFYPSNFIYLHTSNFLLQRPSIDISDVPLLYGMLYSSSDEHWKKDRTWIIKFLADGMVDSEDWKVLQRRHTWDLLASLFQSEVPQASGSTYILRSGILDVLANLTCNPKATTSLVTKSALLPWIEMQIFNSSPVSEGLEWVRILENILVVADIDKVEAATKGEWKSSICRCLSRLLENQSQTSGLLPYATPLILRLASLHQHGEDHLEPVLKLALACLETLEKELRHPAPSTYAEESEIYSVFQKPPHRSIRLRHRITPESNSISLMIWKRIVETLWTSVMLLDKKSSIWDALGSRLILINNWTMESTTSQKMSEWVRRELIRTLGNETQVVVS